MAKIWKRRDRDVWVADYRNAAGERKRLTAATRDEAEQLLAEKVQEVKKELREGNLVKPLYWDYALKDYVPVFLDRAKDELEEKTWRSYRQNLEHHVVPVLGKVLVRDISVSRIAKFLAEKRKARYGAKEGVEGKAYSRTALRLMKAALSSLLTDAVEVDEILKMNPALAVASRKKRHRSKVADPEPNPMTPEQLAVFLSQAMLREQHNLLPYRVRFMWELRAKTGLRPEEAYGLHVGDIDLHRGTIRIERAVSLGKIKGTKTEEKREVELSDGLAASLAEYLGLVTAEAIAAGWPEPHWLFPSRSGGLVGEADERWHRDLFKQTLHAAKLPSFVPYDLRHTTASILLSNPDKPAPLLYVSRLLGHKKPTTTLAHYAKWIPSGEQRFVNVMDSIPKKLGTKSGHQVDIIEKEDTEVIEKFGGPCRGRTYGPLIKSQLLYQLS